MTLGCKRRRTLVLHLNHVWFTMASLSEGSRTCDWDPLCVCVCVHEHLSDNQKQQSSSVRLWKELTLQRKSISDQDISQAPFRTFFCTQMYTRPFFLNMKRWIEKKGKCRINFLESCWWWRAMLWSASAQMARMRHFDCAAFRDEGICIAYRG